MNTFLDNICKRNAADIMKERTCCVCHYRGTDVTEQPTYDAILGRDSTDYFCTDLRACLDRVEA
jgi:hypothetical protein